MSVTVFDELGVIPKVMLLLRSSLGLDLNAKFISFVSIT